MQSAPEPVIVVLEILVRKERLKQLVPSVSVVSIIFRAATAASFQPPSFTFCNQTLDTRVGFECHWGRSRRFVVVAIRTSASKCANNSKAKALAASAALSCDPPASAERFR